MPLFAACSLWEDDEAEDPAVEEPAAATPTPSPTPEPITGESVLSGASEQWSETESVHFLLDAQGDTFLDADGNIRLISAEGDLARPDAVEATARVDVAVATVPVELIVIGEDAYLTNFISGNWERAPDDFEYNPALLFSDTDGLGPIMEDIQDPELDGTESVDGRNAHRVTGVVTEEQINDITAGSIEGENIDVTLWIAEDNFEVLRLVISAPPIEDTGETTWDLTFTDHNADVEIEAPI
jgi:hypothetical protein